MKSALLSSVASGALVMLSATLPAGAAMAQTRPDSAQTSAGNDAGPAEIIVTAQRRDESLSKTPVAISVLSADTLAKANVTTEADLRSVTPGLQIRSGQNSNQLNYAIRGQSQDAYSDTRPGVLPYLNEVQIGGAGGSSAFYDLQSIQVLKGPQGTLFGRSATGGAVLFTTAKPSDDVGGYFSALGGNYSTAKVEGALNMPIVSGKIDARIAGFYDTHDGFQHNLYDNSRPGNLERYGFRGSVTAKLNDTLKNEFVIDYYHADGTNTLGVISGLLPFTGSPPPFIPITFLYAGNATPLARATGIGTVQAFLAAAGPAVQGLVPAYYDAYFSDRRHPSTGISGFFADQQARGPYTVSSNAPNLYLAKNIIITNATTFHLSDTTQIKNIFGYTKLDSTLRLDSDGTPFGIGAGQNIVYNTRQISDELQLQGTLLAERLNYTVGGYFSDEKNVTHQLSSFFDILLGPTLQPNDFDIKNRTYAGYAQATYKLTDSISATAGTRYTSERVTKVLLPTDVNRIESAPGAPFMRASTYNRVSWTLGLQDQLDRSTLLYVASHRAYKSGGFNGIRPIAPGFGETGGDAYRAEQVTDVEAGAKFNGRLAQMPVRADLAAFYTWDNNRQTTAYALIGIQPAAITVNVPAARLYGAEFDLSVSPAPWLTVGGAATYTHSRFTNGNVNALGTPQVYDQLPDSPTYSATLYADITAPLSPTIDGILHADGFAQAKSFTVPNSTNYAGTTMPAYALLNLRAGIQVKNYGLTITGNVKNVLDKVYYVGGVGAGELYQVNTLVPGTPRTFTLELRYKF